MRLSAMLFMYRRRLRSHGLQELLAAVGIAIAVALVFAALISESSIEGSAQRVVQKVIGPASLQLRARNEEGFSEAVLARVKTLPGIERAAPLLEQRASVVAADGRQVHLQLAGTDLRLATIDGLAETLPIGSLSSKGIGLSLASAKALGLGAHAKHARVTLELRGVAASMRVTAVLGQEAAGALAGAFVAVMPMRDMQRLARLSGRVSRIFVVPDRGEREAVASELRRMPSSTFEVAPANEDVALLREALGPSGLASGLFAAIGALLGFLLAFNAMLLTVAERRRAIADLRVSGARRMTICEMVIFEALCLAIPASLLGLLCGYLLSTGVFHQSTDYLAEAFTLSSSTLVGVRSAGIALLSGLLATCAASLLPLLDLRRSQARDAIYASEGVPGDGMGARTRRRLALIAVCLVAGASALWLALPVAAIPATALLALATVLVVPLTFAGALAATAAIGERMQRLAILPLALASLRASSLRSLALAATGAVALFGSVALGGSRRDLLSGIDAFARSYVADAGIWITNPGDNQAVASFPAASDAAKLRGVPGVRSVQAFDGGFLQLGARRVWVIARPALAERHVLATQLRDGSLRVALRKIEAGRSVAISQQIAAERHLHIGQRIALPTPTGVHRYVIAATTTNLAWPPGVIFMSAEAYAQAWGGADPSALGVELAAGASGSATQRRIETALGRGSGLEVSLAATRAKHIEALASEGLGQLQEVSTMLLLAAIVAMIAALCSSVWQRRRALAGLRLFGARRLSLQALLMIEAVVMLGAGCVTGTLAGLYGQFVIDAFLRHVTGFPLVSPTTSARPLEILALALLGALAAGMLPSWLACRVPATFALTGE